MENKTISLKDQYKEQRYVDLKQILEAVWSQCNFDELEDNVVYEYAVYEFNGLAEDLGFEDAPTYLERLSKLEDEKVCRQVHCVNCGCHLTEAEQHKEGYDLENEDNTTNELICPICGGIFLVVLIDFLENSENPDETDELDTQSLI